MTGNLKLMTLLHDQVVADEVGQMAELGYFDVEFTMYGCAYLEHGKRYYKISPEAADIYQFIEKSNLKGIFPSNVIQYTQKCAVPAGAKEVIAQEVKIELAKQLSDLFPIAFLENIQKLAEAVTENAADDMLWKQAEELEGLFDIERLRRFEQKVDYMYSCRKLTESSYHQLHAWLKEELKSMTENYETKDIFEKTMYGAMYIDNGRPRYIENARMEYVYEKIYHIETQGGVVTPIFGKTYYYNYRYRLSDVIQDYKSALHNEYNESYLYELEQIRCSDRFEKMIVDSVIQVRENFGIKAAETLLRYADRWGVYRRDVLKFTL